MSRRHETTSFLFLGPTGRPDWSLFCDRTGYPPNATWATPRPKWSLLYETNMSRTGLLRPERFPEISGPGYPPNGTWATPGPKCSLLYETNMSRSGLLRPGRFTPRSLPMESRGRPGMRWIGAFTLAAVRDALGRAGRGGEGRLGGRCYRLRGRIIELRDLIFGT